MRPATLRLAVAPLLAAACVHPVRFHPAAPEQAVAGQPDSASAEQGGVRVVVHAGGWRGAPDDVEDRLTPIEVYVENDSGRAVKIGPEYFGLVAENGFHYQPLDPREVQRVASPAYGSGAVVYYGYYGAYPWPGFWSPWHRHRFYPWAWSDWYGPPVAYYAPATPPPPAPRGALQDDGHISLLLFFPVPARSLSFMEVTADLVDEAGRPIATLRLPLLREGVTAPPPATPRPAGAGAVPAPSPGTPPASATPPSPPPSSPPPPPTSTPAAPPGAPPRPPFDDAPPTVTPPRPAPVG